MLHYRKDADTVMRGIKAAATKYTEKQQPSVVVMLLL